MILDRSHRTPFYNSMFCQTRPLKFLKNICSETVLLSIIGYIGITKLFVLFSIYNDKSGLKND